MSFNHETLGTFGRYRPKNGKMHFAKMVYIVILIPFLPWPLDIILTAIGLFVIYMYADIHFPGQGLVSCPPHWNFCTCDSLNTIFMEIFIISAAENIKLTQ